MLFRLEKRDVVTHQLWPVLPRTMYALLFLLAFAAFPAHAEEMDTVYAEPPDIANCEPGAVAEREKEAVLDYVNEIRSRHGLAPVTYDETYDEETAQAALLIVANNYMTHFPAEDSECYTEAGATGSASSNLYWGSPEEGHGDPLLAPSTANVRGWLIDEDVPALGHRRWLLDPFLHKISYGRVDGPPVGDDADRVGHGSALKVIYAEKPKLDDTAPDFVAYPYGDYPVDLFKLGWYWSFSALVDPSDPWQNEAIDFSKATVTVRRGRRTLTVRNVSFNNDGIGLPNHLQWQVPDARIDVPYTVEIANVDVAGRLRSYTYDVMFTEPLYSRVDAPVYAVDGRNAVVEVRSGETFALAMQPPTTLPSRYSYTQGMALQTAWVSPYVSLWRLRGTLGDEASIAHGRTTTILRIVETDDGERDPLAVLARELAIPIYQVEGQGETVEAVAPSRIAVYVQPTPAESRIRQLRWQYEQGLIFTAEFHNANTILIEITASPLGRTATFDLGSNRTFTLKIVRRLTPTPSR